MSEPVAIHLPPIKEFDLKGDPSTVSQRWQNSRNDEIFKNVKEQIETEKWSKNAEYKPYFLSRKELWIKDDII